MSRVPSGFWKQPAEASRLGSSALRAGEMPLSRQKQVAAVLSQGRLCHRSDLAAQVPLRGGDQSLTLPDISVGPGRSKESCKSCELLGLNEGGRHAVGMGRQRRALGKYSRRVCWLWCQALDIHASEGCSGVGGKCALWKACHESRNFLHQNKRVFHSGGFLFFFPRSSWHRK